MTKTYDKIMTKKLNMKMTNDYYIMTNYYGMMTMKLLYDYNVTTT